MWAWSGHQSLRQRAMALSAREQSLALMVIAMGLYFMADTWLITPQGIQLQTLRDAQTVTQTQRLAVRQEMASLEPANDALAAQNRLVHQRVKAQLELFNRINASIHEHRPSLKVLVGDVLKVQHPRVTLTQFKTLAVKPLVPGIPSKNSDRVAQKTAALYRHGFEIEVRGSYLDLLAYVQSLESQTAGVLWSDVQLSTVNYPESVLRMTLFFMSDQARWKLS